MITCKELGMLLIQLGELPIKLVVEKDGVCTTTSMIHDVDLDVRHKQQTSYGDIDLVRLTVVDEDDA